MAQSDTSTQKAEAMMKAVLSETKNVSFSGLQATMLFKQDEQKECNGDLFVRLNPRNRSLISMVCEDNPNAPKPTPTSATCIKALAGMMHMRNKAQSELMKPADGCSLFSDVTPKNVHPGLEWLGLRRRRNERMLLQ